MMADGGFAAMAGDAARFAINQTVFEVKTGRKGYVTRITEGGYFVTFHRDNPDAAVLMAEHMIAEAAPINKRDVAMTGFSLGQSVTVDDPEDGEYYCFTIGQEYLFKSPKGSGLGILIGCMEPMRWDDVREKYVPCSVDNMDCYRFGVIRDQNGKNHWLSGHYILEQYDSLERLPEPKLHFLSYDDMLAMPDPEPLVEGLIFKQTSALLFGKSNAFKSFLGIDIACSVATGTDWHGHEVGQPARVLYVATEGSNGVGSQRIPGWMEAHGIAPELRHNIELFPDEVALDDPSWVDAVLQTAAVMKARETIKAGGKVADLDGYQKGAYALIIVDIFGASMNGPETSDETARAWVRSVNRLMKEIGCAVLTVAHTGWADETRARMHTHFWGSFDTRLKAEGDKDSLTTVLTVDRHKDADSSGQWGFRMEKVTTPKGATTLFPRLCDEVEKGQKRRVSGKPAVALQALSEALIDHGKTIAGPNYPACPVVSLEAWRAMCDRHGLADSDNPESLKKAFMRAKKTLIEKGLIRQFDNHVWRSGNDA